MNKFWDEVVAGPQPDHGIAKLRKLTTNLNKGEAGDGSKYQRSMSMPATPGTPGTPTTLSPSGAHKENTWRRMWSPGSNPATNNIGAHKFDKPEPNTPTVYDWMYSDGTKSTYR